MVCFFCRSKFVYCRFIENQKSIKIIFIWAAKLVFCLKKKTKTVPRRFRGSPSGLRALRATHRCGRVPFQVKTSGEVSSPPYFEFRPKTNCFTSLAQDGQKRTGRRIIASWGTRAPETGRGGRPWATDGRNRALTSRKAAVAPLFLGLFLLRRKFVYCRFIIEKNCALGFVYRFKVHALLGSHPNACRRFVI